MSRRPRCWPALLLLLVFSGWAFGHVHTPPPLPAGSVDLSDTRTVRDQVKRLRGMHRYAEAEELARRSVTWIEREFGSHSEEARFAYLTLLSTLRVTNRNSIEERKIYAVRAIDAAEHLYGVRSQPYFQAQTVLERVLIDAGAYDAAYQSGVHRLRAAEETFGDDDPFIAWLLLDSNWALKRAARTAEARAYLDRALEILDSLDDPHPGWLERVLRSRGGLALDDGKLTLAERLFDRAESVIRARFGPGTLRFGLLRLDQARLRVAQGRYDEARRLGMSALRNHEAVYGSDDVCLLRVLPTYADVLLRGGDVASAIEVYERALRLLVRERDYELWRRRIPGILNGLATARWRAGEPHRAIEAAIESVRLGRERLVVRVQGLPEREALIQDSLFESGLDTVLGIFFDIPPEKRDPEMTLRVWDEIVRSRALVLEEITMRTRFAARTGTANSEAAETYRRASTRLSNLIQRGSHTEFLEALRERDEAEVRWARSNLHDRADRRAIGLRDVLPALPVGSRLVSFVRFDGAGKPSYGVWIGGPDGKVEVHLLESAAEIDVLIERWRVAVGTDPRHDRTTIERVRGIGTELRKRIWDPVVESLAGARYVFVVPDGAIHLINLETLPTGSDRWLLDSGPMMHLLSAERDVVRFRTERSEKAGGILAIGAPDFDVRETEPPARDSPPRYRSPIPSCPQFRSLHFEPLPATRHEIGEIASASGATSTLLAGSDATEGHFKDLAPGHAYVHIATHGFFVPDRCDVRTEIDGLAPNPLLYTGLALAGANHRSPADGPDGEDGILTAAEIASLDLTGVRWAVLSACETALGDLRNGEGVLGLRRAFEIAGAGTTIMSLWKVEDGVTAEWMKTLYRDRAEGLSTIEAVHRARVHLLRMLRERGRSEHPFFWGGFVAAGDWR